MDSATEKKEENTIVYLFNELNVGKKSSKHHKTPYKTPFKKAKSFKSLIDIEKICEAYDLALESTGPKQIENAQLVLSQLLSAIEINATDQLYDLLSRTYNMLGTAHAAQDNFDLQVYYCNEAIVAADNIEDQDTQSYLKAKALINIAVAIYNQNKDDLGLSGFEKAVNILESISWPQNNVYYLLLFAYEQILNVYNQSGNLRNAKTEDIPYKALYIFAQIQFPNEEIMKMRDLFIQYFPNANFAFSKKRKSVEFFTADDDGEEKTIQLPLPSSPS